MLILCIRTTDMCSCDCCLLLFLVFFIHPGISSCISNLEVENISSTKVTISWLSECSRSTYTVMWTHLQFVSCDEQGMLSPHNNRTVLGRTRTELGQLLPYSVYNISVSSPGEQGQGASVMIVTEESIPQVCSMFHPYCTTQSMNRGGSP